MKDKTNETVVVNKRTISVMEQDKHVYIGRPSRWGNPFSIGRDGNRAEVIEKYRVWFFEQDERFFRDLEKLRGKSLVCFCAPLSCHGDVIKEFLDNRDEKEVSTCDSCGEVLPIEEFDDWYRCPDCSHFNEPPSWQEEEVSPCDSCDEPHQPAACHFCDASDLTTAGCELCGKLFPYEDLNDYSRCPACSN
jgi:DNA-directed RNA polymerase subunit RPC12/RpoP